MLQSVSEINDQQNPTPGDATTVKCQIISGPRPGRDNEDVIIYLVDDLRANIENDVVLSFWKGETPFNGVDKTANRVWETLSIPRPTDLSSGNYDPDDATLQEGEEILARVIPNRAEPTGSLYLNVTSFVIREPNTRISKSDIRGQSGDECPRKRYLEHEKHVYAGQGSSRSPRMLGPTFRGDAIHKITENALGENLDAICNGEWTDIQEFSEAQLNEHFAFRQARLILAGVKLNDIKETILHTVENLFTDDEFLNRIQSAANVETERFLDDRYGYGGRVDILLDGVPYDIKTTHDPTDSKIQDDKEQLKLYSFVLLLEDIGVGESFEEAIQTSRSAHLIYPNVSGSVQFEPVELTMTDVRRFLAARTEVQSVGNIYAPPSTYNRDCDGCQFSVDEWVTGEDDVLPPACTYHCQNERRWPCYNTDGKELTTDCSLFDKCDQRNEYRNPDTIDHFESIRSAFKKEQDARTTTGRMVKKFDNDLLIKGGYRIPDLSFEGIRLEGSIIRFTTDTVVTPAFSPGEVVKIRNQDETTVDRAIYQGKQDGEYLFSPVDSSFSIRSYIKSQSKYNVEYEFDGDSITTRHLPYLDYAQRRNNGDPIDIANDTEADSEPPKIVEPSDVVEYLDSEQLFVDLPVGTQRRHNLVTLLRELVTAPYPHLWKNERVPEEARRALVLGTTPTLIETAAQSQPDGAHYRLNGIADENSISNKDDPHEIQTKLLESRSIVSTVQHAESADGIGGIRDFFHRMDEADNKDYTNRDFSDRFFDVVVLVGAEKLTEPEFHYLSDIGDRVVAIGDRRQKGPSMMSDAALETGLGGFFRQEFDRYQSFPTENSVSLQIRGQAPPALQTFDKTGPWDPIDGELIFQNIESDESNSLENIEFETTVPATNDIGRRLVFDITDTMISPIEAYELFQERIELDATKLADKSVVLLDGESLFLESKERLDGANANDHKITVRALASELEEFSQGVVQNRIAQKVVKQVVKEDAPDLVVTPFGGHATELKQSFNENDINVPVRKPEQLSGNIADHAVLSFVVSNQNKSVRPPLDQPETLYALFSAGQNLTMVGNKATLRSKTIFARLIESATQRTHTT